MNWKWHYMFIGLQTNLYHLVSLEEKLCRLAGRYCWLLASKSASCSKNLAACLQLLHSSPQTRDLARRMQRTP